MDAERLAQAGIYWDRKSGKYITRCGAIVQRIQTARKRGEKDVAIATYRNGDQKEIALPGVKK